MNTDSRVAALIRSALAAALGYIILWIVLEAGKIAFGKKGSGSTRQLRLVGRGMRTTPILLWARSEVCGAITLPGKATVFLLYCHEAKIDSRSYGEVTLDFHYNRLKAGDDEFPLDQVNEISGVARELQIPREAMGRGDLKFLAAIGAFLGWRAVLFSLFGGSLVGSLVGLVTLALGKRVWSAKLPFGPYLAFGALIWMFFGDELMRWYIGLLSP